MNSQYFWLTARIQLCNVFGFFFPLEDLAAEECAPNFVQALLAENKFISLETLNATELCLEKCCDGIQGKGNLKICFLGLFVV